LGQLGRIYTINIALVSLGIYLIRSTDLTGRRIKKITIITSDTTVTLNTVRQTSLHGHLFLQTRTNHTPNRGPRRVVPASRFSARFLPRPDHGGPDWPGEPRCQQLPSPCIIIASASGTLQSCNRCHAVVGEQERDAAGLTGDSS